MRKELTNFSLPSHITSNKTKIKFMIKKMVQKILFGKPTSGERMEGLGTLQIKQTIVPKSFLKKNSKWDSHLYNNIVVIENI